jgi:hypothetical protein
MEWFRDWDSLFARSHARLGLVSLEKAKRKPSVGYVDTENPNENLKSYEDMGITRQIPSQLASLVTYGVESTKWKLAKRKCGQLGGEQMCGREWL